VDALMIKKIHDIIFKRRIYFLGILNLVLVLLTLNLLSGSLGLFEQLTMRLAAFFVIIGLILLNLPIKRVFKGFLGAEKKLLFWGVLSIFFSFCLLFYFNSFVIWLATISLILLGIIIINNGINKREHTLFLPLFSSFLYTLFMISATNILVFWNYIQKFSLAFTSSVGSVTGKAMVLGPSASGLWILFSFITVCAAILLISKKNLKNTLYFIFSIIGLFIAWFIFLVLQNFYTFESTTDKTNFQYVFLIIGFIPTITYYLLSLKNIKPVDFSFLFNKKGLKNKRVALAIITLFFASIFIISTFPYFSADPSQTKIMLYTGNMLGTWDKPIYGRYGKEASGMFGMLPEYLEASGYSVVLYNDTIKENTLNDVDVFVVINLNVSFTNQEHQRIWNFVEEGGSLLVLGDHTDIAGIMEPLNNLLSPVGIDFRFDSGLPLGDRWVNCIEILNHPIGNDIEDENQIEISVGATLNVSGDAFPVIIGRYGFSDHGNYLNSEMANLGDYINNPGEQLGDVILAAGAFYGKGKVLVFGDTSSFQNLAIPYSYQLIHNVFTWLSCNETQVTKYLKNVFSFLALIACIIIYLKWLKNEKQIIYLLTIILSVSLFASAAINPLFIEKERIGGENIVYIDTSHLERISLDSYTSDATTGLMLSLARNDYLPIILRKFDKEKISNSKILVLIAPTIPLTKNEVDFLKRYMSDGGLIILSTGYQDETASSLLLKEFDFSIENIPLGPVPYVEENPEQYQNEPRFVDSWPIVAENDSSVDAFYTIEIENETYNLIMFKKYGLGGLLIIGDSQFLLDKNIESLYNYWPGNILFLKNIIDELKDKGVL
jgi:type IV secretory pathway VirB2 component (pilin)